MQQHLITASLPQQRGAVLIVSMLLLLIVTILALGASQSTRWQQRMSADQRNHELAFQSAEAALRAGERIIDNAMTAPPAPCGLVTNPPCLVYEPGFLNAIVSYQDQVFESDEWWAARAQPYSGTGAALIAGSAGEGLAKSDPQFYIEQIEVVPDALSVPPTGPPPSLVYYRVVARSEGGTDNARVVLHSTYARRFN